MKYYLGKALVGSDGKRITTSRGDFQYCCPFCEGLGRTSDREYKLCVSVRKGLYHCYRCGSSGRIGDLAFSRSDLHNMAIEEKRPPIGMTDWLGETSPIMEGSIEWKYLTGERKKGRAVNIRTDERSNPWSANVFQVSDNHSWRVILGSFSGFPYVAYSIIAGASPKAINAPGEKKIFNPRGLSECDSLWVVEGPMDCFSCPSSVALLGKTVTSGMVEEISKIKCRRVVVCLDGGEDKGAGGVLHAISKIVGMRKMWFVKLPVGVDPNDCGLTSKDAHEYFGSSIEDFIYHSSKLPIMRSLPCAPVPAYQQQGEPSR